MQEIGQGVEASRCADCGTALVGRYCHACGEDSRPPSRRLRDIAEDVLDNVFEFTSDVPRTLVALFTRPSLVPRALRAGDRRSFLSPVKLYVTATVVFFLFLGLADVSIVQWSVVRTGDGPIQVRVEDGAVTGLENFRLMDRWLHPEVQHGRNAEVTAAFEQAAPLITDEFERALVQGTRAVAEHPAWINERISTWTPRILWLLMPVYALLLWPLHARGRLISDHVIFALWAHTMIFLLLIGGAVWNVGLEAAASALGRPFESGRGLVLALVAYQAYLTMALRGYYEQSWTLAVIKGVLHTMLYVGLIWGPLSIGMLMAWPALEHLPEGYLLE